MKKTLIKYLTPTGVLLVLFVLFTLLVKVVDVSSVGPLESSVGLSTINSAIFTKVGTNSILDKLTDIFLLISIAVACSLFFVGVVQFIKRKNIFKIDKEILVTAILYALIAAFYLLFEIVEINFRPILVDLQLEASYPSSHTLIVCSIMISSIFALSKLIKTSVIKYLYMSFAIIIVILNTAFRLMSGMHWFTDIIAGILLSAFLIMLYVAIIKIIESKNKINVTTVLESENSEV